MTEKDLALFHYAVGILVGLGQRHDVLDITIYNGQFRVRIEPLEGCGGGKRRGRPDRDGAHEDL